MVFRKAVGAGVLIGIGAAVYLSCPNKIVGAILFSTGLFFICSFGLNLFTGKIGYILENKNNPNCAVIWLGNLVGTLICSLPLRIVKPNLAQTAMQMAEAKTAQGMLVMGVTAIFCGMLMYIAVENFRSNKSDFGKNIGIFLCVSVFIICGFEHSIADMCYFIYAANNIYNAGLYLLFVLIISISNGIGALFINYLIYGIKEH